MRAQEKVRAHVFRAMRAAFGKGWMYRFPRYYERTIDYRFKDVREEAFRYLLGRIDGLSGMKTCLDVACGTGITSLWLAAACKDLQVIGIDSNAGMLKLAKRRAEEMGLGDRCVFLQADVATIRIEDLPSLKIDMVTCSLGFSVIPAWQETFRNTRGILDDKGVYVIFDEFVRGLRVADFSSDQTRESWKLVEGGFIRAETKWLGNSFISFGTEKAPGYA